MRAKLLAVVLGVSLLGSGALPRAHHSFGAEFDQNKPITLKGTLTKVQWVNPHGWLYVDVKGADGAVVNWAIEAGSASSMLRRGLRHTDFPIGVEVIVEGYLAKNGRPIANGKEVKFSNGRNFFLGSSLGAESVAAKP